jgi:hypothetical protein
LWFGSRHGGGSATDRHYVMRPEVHLHRRRRALVLGVVGAGVALAVILWSIRGGMIEPHPGVADPTARSSDVAADIKLMWATQPLKGNAGPQAGPNPQASTDRAIKAASRVFNTVQLVGKTREEVVKLLGDPRASNSSVYNFPFWPVAAGSLVYRFDSGAYGWQFNVVVGTDGKVSAVERHWIH